MGYVSNPGDPGAELVVSETEVFNATSVNAAWTDLNLSSLIGVNAALVILKVTAGAGCVLSVRKNGDTGDYTGTGTQGAAQAALSSGKEIVVVCHADAAGIIEYYTSSAQAMIMKVIGYLRLR